MFRKSLLLLLIVAGFGIYGAGSYYTVQTHEGFKFYPKKNFSLEKVYVDARKLGITDLSEHSGLVRRMIEEGDFQYLPGGRALDKLDQMGKDVDQFLEENETVEQINQSLEEISNEAGKKLEKIKNSDQLQETAEQVKEKVKEGAEKVKDVIK